MTMQMYSTTITLALTRTNNFSGSPFYIMVNFSKYPYYTKIYKKNLDIVSFASTNTDGQQSFDFTEVASFYRNRDFHSRNFVKKSISFIIVVNLLTTNKMK